MPAGTGTPEGTRTPDLLLRRQLLYPAELLAHVERVMGIEPTRPAWKAGVLPLNYTRRGFFPCLQELARQKGLEPLTYCLEGSCSIQLSYWRMWSG